MPKIKIFLAIQFSDALLILLVNVKNAYQLLILSEFKPFYTLIVFLRDLFRTSILKKVSRRQQKHVKLSSMQRVDVQFI